MKLFKKDMEEAENATSGKRNIPAYKTILVEEYWKIPDDRFFDIIYEALDDVKSGNLELIDIAKLYVYYVYFSKNKLISFDIPTLKDIFIKGMNLAVIHSKYFPNIKDELEKISIYNSSEDIEEVVNRFNDLNNQLLEKDYEIKAEEIFKCIPMKMENFYERFDKECMDVPILKYYDPYKMFQRILCASNEDTVIIKERLIKRASMYPEVLKEEKENMLQLKQMIDDYLKGKDTTIKTVIFQGFSEDLEALCQLV